MDAFYVSVEMLRHPELRGKPVVVAYDGPRGVVTTASYEARKYGVHSALPMVTARRRCPDLTVLPGRHAALPARLGQGDGDAARVQRRRSRWSGWTRPTSTSPGSPVPQSRAHEIKRRIKEATWLVCSIGLAPNKLMAKIASDLDKPDGFFVLTEENWLRAWSAIARPRSSPASARGPSSGCRRIGIGRWRSWRDRRAGLLERDLRAEARPRACATAPTASAASRLDDGADPQVREPRDDLPRGRHRPAGAARDASSAWRARSARASPSNERTGPHGDAEDPAAARSRPTRARGRSSPTPATRTTSSRRRGELLERFDPQAPVRLVGVGVAGLARSDEPNQRPGQGPRDRGRGRAAGGLNPASTSGWSARSRSRGSRASPWWRRSGRTRGCPRRGRGRSRGR